MDAHGTIHTHAEIEDLRAVAANKMLNAIVRENIKAKLEGLVDVPDDYLDVLETLPRARRIAWYAEAKKAAKHGRPVPAPKEI